MRESKKKNFFSKNGAKRGEEKIYVITLGRKGKGGGRKKAKIN